MHLLWGASGFPDSRSSHSRTRKQDHCSESSERSVRVQNRNPWEIRRLKTAAAHQRRWINGTQVTNVAAACYTAGPGCHSESNERSLRNSLWIQALVGDYSQPCAEACDWSGGLLLQCPQPVTSSSSASSSPLGQSAKALFPV